MPSGQDFSEVVGPRAYLRRICLPAFAHPPSSKTPETGNRAGRMTNLHDVAGYPAADLPHGCLESETDAGNTLETPFWS